MKLVESIMTNNPCYVSGRKITVKGLMLHSVGCPQPKASAFINNWNKVSYTAACVHAFIDGNEGTVYQTLPWNHRGWHCGSGSKGSGNNTHIGVEMCEPACIKYTGGSSFTCSDTATAKAVAKRTYEAAVELFAYLCKAYNLNPEADGVIISHREGCSRGIASNHADPEHLWNGLGMGYTMAGFRKAVKVAMSGSTPSGGTPLVPSAYTTGLYRVTVSSLNIRKGPGMDYDVARVITDKGTYTIVEIKNGSWGRLKSGAGWINCSEAYCKKVSGTSASISFGGGSSSFKVEVSITDLRIRTGPGTGYSIVQYCPKGVYTIVETVSRGGYTWGRLKSGAGWIALEYARRL